MVSMLISKLMGLLIVMLAGAGLSRVGLLDKTLRQGLNRLLFNFVLPMMVFSSMRSTMTCELLSTSFVPVLLGAGLCFVNWGSARLLSMLFGIPCSERHLVSFLNMFGNNLYLGLPIALAVFGSEGVAVVLLFSLGSDTILWTLGLLLLSPRQDISVNNFKQIFTPTLIGLVLGTLAGVIALPLPLALTDAMTSVASTASPFALLLTGAALAEIDFANGVFSKHVPVLVLGRLVVSPAIAALALTFLTVDPMMSTMVVILAAMPTFVRSIVLTDKYGWNSQQAAMGVLVTTLGSFLTIPLLVQFLGR
ncbi:MAG: AEC family transporter [Peptococcaceae bacterium]|nr:AEC family transporter [Peptococcaceae bacterium]